MKFAVHIMLPKRRPPNGDDAGDVQPAPGDDRAFLATALKIVAVPIEPEDTFADLCKLAGTRLINAGGRDRMAGMGFGLLHDLQGAEIFLEDKIGSMYKESMPSSELQLRLYLEEVDGESTIPLDSAPRPKGFKRKACDDLNDVEQASLKKRRKREELYGSTVDDPHPGSPVLSREAVNDSDIVAGANQDLEPVRIDVDGFKIPKKPIKTPQKSWIQAEPCQPIVLVSRSQPETDAALETSREGRAKSKMGRTASSGTALREQRQSARRKITPKSPGDNDAKLPETPPTPSAGTNEPGLQQTPPSGQRTQTPQMTSTARLHKGSPRSTSQFVGEKDITEDDLDVEDIEGTYDGTGDIIDDPTAFQLISSSQSASAVAKRRTSSNPQWTPAEDKILLKGIRHDWNSDQIARALPKDIYRTQSAIRGRKVILKKKFPTGVPPKHDPRYSEGNEAAPPSSGRNRWAESDLIILRRAMAAGFNAPEIHEQKFPCRSMESVLHRYRSLWDIVVHTERRKPSFPCDKIRTSDWSDQDSLKLRRMYMQRIPVERACALWFSGWPKEVIAKKYNTYKEQMRALSISPEANDGSTSVITHAGAESAETVKTFSTTGLESLPRSSNIAITPDVLDGSVSLTTQTAVMSSPCVDVVDRQYEEERQTGQLRRAAAQGGQTTLNWHRDKGKKTAHGNRVNTAELDQRFGRGSSTTGNSGSQPVMEISSDESSNSRGNEVDDEEIVDRTSPINLTKDDTPVVADELDEREDEQPTRVDYHFERHGIPVTIVAHSPAPATEERRATRLSSKRSRRDNSTPFAPTSKPEDHSEPVDTPESTIGSLQDRFLADDDEDNTADIESPPQSRPIAYVQLPSPREIQLDAANESRRRRRTRRRRSGDITSDSASESSADQPPPSISFLDDGTHETAATDYEAGEDHVAHGRNGQTATPSASVSVSSRTSSGKLRQPTRAANSASRLFGTRQPSHSTIRREASVQVEDPVATTQLSEVVDDEEEEEEAENTTLVDAPEEQSGTEDTAVPAAAEEQVGGVVFDDDKIRVTLPSARDSGLFKERTNANRWKDAYKAAGGDRDKAMQFLKIGLNEEDMMDAVMRGETEEILRLKAQRRRYKREFAGSSRRPRRNGPLTGLKSVRSGGDRQNADEEVVRDDDWTTADEDERRDGSDDAVGPDDGVEGMHDESSEDEYDGMEVVDLGGRVLEEEEEESVEARSTAHRRRPPVKVQTSPEAVNPTPPSDLREHSPLLHDSVTAVDDSSPANIPVAPPAGTPEVSSRGGSLLRESFSKSTRSDSFSITPNMAPGKKSKEAPRKTRSRKSGQARRASSVSTASHATPARSATPRPAGVSKRAGKRGRKYERNRAGQTGQLRTADELDASGKGADEVPTRHDDDTSDDSSDDEPSKSTTVYSMNQTPMNNATLGKPAARPVNARLAPAVNAASSTSGYSDAVTETPATSAAPLSPEVKRTRLSPYYPPPPKPRSPTPTKEEIQAKIQKQACPYPSSDEESSTSSSSSD